MAFEADASRYVDPDSAAPLEGMSTVAVGGFDMVTVTGALVVESPLLSVATLWMVYVPLASPDVL